MKDKRSERLEVPRNNNEVKSFLGLASYYRKFVEGYAAIATKAIK